MKRISPSLGLVAAVVFAELALALVARGQNWEEKPADQPYPTSAGVPSSAPTAGEPAIVTPGNGAQMPPCMAASLTPAADAFQEPCGGGCCRSRCGGCGNPCGGCREVYAATMIGDVFVPPGVSFSYIRQSSARAPLPGSATPRFRMAENTSPLPEDRVYFDYGYSTDVPISDPTIDLNTFVPGFEKKFFGGLMSFELRMPIGNTLNRRVEWNSTDPDVHGQFGDLGMALKTLLRQTPDCAISGGMALSVPTAPDTVLSGSDAPTIIVEHESVHLMPFFGLFYTPCDRLFSISYVQVDVDASGDAVEGPGRRAFYGRYRAQTYLYADTSVGYWVYRSRCGHALLSGLAPVFEVHVSQSLDKAQLLDTGNLTMTVADAAGDRVSDVTVVDLTFGVHAELCGNTTASIAYCVPATSTDREFDRQLRLTVNRWF